MKGNPGMRAFSLYISSRACPDEQNHKREMTKVATT